MLKCKKMGMDGQTDNAKTTSLPLHQGIHEVLPIDTEICVQTDGRNGWMDGQHQRFKGYVFSIYSVQGL